MNYEIPEGSVRVLVPSSKGKDEMVGVMHRDTAIEMGKESGADLILINPQADPPICVLCEYSKYRYMKQKREKAARKPVKALKELRFGLNLSIHDYNTRKNHATKFLTQGHQVRAVVKLFGRDITFSARAIKLLEGLAEELRPISTKDGIPKLDGNIVSLLLTPIPQSKSKRV